MRFEAVLLVILGLTVNLTHEHHHDGRDTTKEFSNEWVLHLEGVVGEEVVHIDSCQLIGLKYGFKCLHEVCKQLQLVTA